MKEDRKYSQPIGKVGEKEQERECPNSHGLEHVAHGNPKCGSSSSHDPMVRQRVPAETLLEHARHPVPHDHIKFLDGTEPDAKALANGFVVTGHRAAGHRVDVANGAAVAGNVPLEGEVRELRASHVEIPKVATPEVGNEGHGQHVVHGLAKANRKGPPGSGCALILSPKIFVEEFGECDASPALPKNPLSHPTRGHVGE